MPRVQGRGEAQSGSAAEASRANECAQDFRPSSKGSNLAFRENILT